MRGDLNLGYYLRMTTTRINHTGHNHPNTTAARTACRKSLAGAIVVVNAPETPETTRELIGIYQTANRELPRFRRGTPTHKFHWNNMMYAARNLRARGVDINTI